jgi:hypothetical protein
MENRQDNEGDVIRHVLGMSTRASTKDVVTEIVERTYREMLNAAMKRVAEHDAELP